MKDGLWLGLKPESNEVFVGTAEGVKLACIAKLLTLISLQSILIILFRDEYIHGFELALANFIVTFRN